LNEIIRRKRDSGFRGAQKGPCSALQAIDEALPITVICAASDVSVATTFNQINKSV